MPERAGERPSLLSSCLVPLPYTRTYTSRTCDPYSFITYGVRSGSCQVWIDGELQPGCAGFVLPRGVTAVLPADPIPPLILPIAETYFVLIVAVAAARSSKRGNKRQIQAESRN